jgi:hypothetical protein
VVAVDIDGTLGDFHSHFLEFAADYFDIEVAYSYDGAESFKEWWMDMTNRTAKDWHDVKLAYRQGGMKRTMPLYDQGGDLVDTIIASQAEIWITTTRPYLSLDNIVPDTVEWCRRHAIEYDGILFDEGKYEQLVQRVDPERVVAVVDDLWDMCDAADVAVGRPISMLVATEWNRGIIRDNRYSMEEIIDRIPRLIESWNYAAS